MSIDREDFFCDKCQNEMIIDFTINEDISEPDIKFCCLCGAKYDNDMDLDELGWIRISW